MSCSLFVGLPGSGKTSLLAAFASAYVKKGVHVYSNVYLDLPLEHYTLIRPDWLGVYDISNGVVLLDEGEIIAESRSYKSFSKSMSDFFMLHRHYRVQVFVFCQRYKGVDVKIRTLCDRVYFVRKGLFGFTRYTPIEYRICVPEAGERLGEVVEGYRMPSGLVRLFTTKRIYRPKYYHLFDSYEAPFLAPLPTNDDPCTDNFLN